VDDDDFVGILNSRQPMSYNYACATNLCLVKSFLHHLKSISQSISQNKYVCSSVVVLEDHFTSPCPWTTKSLTIVKNFAFCKQSVTYDHVKSINSVTVKNVLPLPFFTVTQCCYPRGKSLSSRTNLQVLVFVLGLKVLVLVHVLGSQVFVLVLEPKSLTTPLVDVYSAICCR